MSKQEYIIKTGDNWENLARKFNSTPEILASLNNKDLSKSLEVGEKIYLPQQTLRIDVGKDLLAYKQINQRLLSDKDFRQEFLANPQKILEESGASISRDLIPDDFPVLRLMDDQEFKSIAQSNNYIEIRKYLAEKYPELTRSATESIRKGDEIEPADVVVAIDVAVVVAVPAIAVADPIV